MQLLKNLLLWTNSKSEPQGMYGDTSFVETYEDSYIIKINIL